MYIPLQRELETYYMSTADLYRSFSSLGIQRPVYLPFVSIVPKLGHKTLQRRCWLQRPRPSRGPGVPVKLVARTDVAGARHHDDGCCCTTMMNVDVGGWRERGHQDSDSPLHGQSRRQPWVPQQLHRARRGQRETQVDRRTRKETRKQEAGSRKSKTKTVEVLRIS